jgi:hypothetical protein
MRRVSLVLAVLLVGCAPVASAPSPSPATATATAAPASAGAPYAGEGGDTPICPPGQVPITIRELAAHGGKMCALPSAPPIPEVEGPSVPAPPNAQLGPVPMPDVALKANAFAWTAAPPLRRAIDAVPQHAVDEFGRELMRYLDQLRGVGPYANHGPVTDAMWDQRVWPGPFQQIARRVVGAKPPQGRFFHLESVRLDAAYSLPWAGGGYQLADVTVSFRDHAEHPPAEGDLWYTWHLRAPMGQVSIGVIADGYDASARGLMRVDPYWSRAQLEEEATSAVAGYLWSESYASGAYEPFWRPQTTLFGSERNASLERMRALFRDGALTDRRFENVAVRIDRFDPLTYFGGGVATVTITGRLVEVLRGKTYVESFSAPMKFFRFGTGALGISGWFPVDAFQDGAWVSGGDLALGSLQTTFG